MRARRSRTTPAATSKIHDSAVTVKKNSPRDEVRSRDGEHPERMGVGLNALVRVVGQPVAVHEIPHRPEGDVGVVAHPGVGEKDIGEKHQERRADEAEGAGVAHTRIGRAERRWNTRCFTMPAKARKIKG